MIVMKRLALAAVLAVLPAVAPIAKEAPHPAADVAATGMVDLFDKSCIAYAGRLPRLKIWLDTNATQAKENQTSYFLAGMQGKVWLLNKPGNYAIIVSDQLNMCQVKAEKAPVDDAATYFTTKAAPAAKLALKQASDEPDGSFMGVSGRVVTYTLQNGGVNYLVVLAGSQKANSAIQSQMTIALQGSDK